MFLVFFKFKKSTEIFVRRGTFKNFKKVNVTLHQYITKIHYFKLYENNSKPLIQGTNDRIKTSE